MPTFLMITTLHMPKNEGCSSSISNQFICRQANNKMFQPQGTTTNGGNRLSTSTQGLMSSLCNETCSLSTNHQLPRVQSTTGIHQRQGKKSFASNAQQHRRNARNTPATSIRESYAISKHSASKKFLTDYR